jgi:hypothetical protein
LRFSARLPPVTAGRSGHGWRRLACTGGGGSCCIELAQPVSIKAQLRSNIKRLLDDTFDLLGDSDELGAQLGLALLMAHSGLVDDLGVAELSTSASKSPMRLVDGELYYSAEIPTIRASPPNLLSPLQFMGCFTEKEKSNG